MKQQFFSESSYFKTVQTSYKIKDVLHDSQSKWQKIQVFDTHALGKLLVLDGKTMVSDADEFVYHESIAHIPTMVSRNAKRALVIGGGDGGIVRELVKYPQLEVIDLVEIDDEVINVSKKFFSSCTSGLSDPRVCVYPEDGIKFIQSVKVPYDIIIIDSTDPENFAKGLFTEEFYANVNKALTEHGIMCAQTENPFLDEYGIKDIYKNLQNAFPIVSAFSAPMLIYPGVFWTFAFASKHYKGTDINPENAETMEKIEKDLKWYNRSWHVGSFAQSNYVKNKLGI